MTTWTDAVLATAPYGWWKLDEASGTSAADSSGNGRTATYDGNTSITYQVATSIPGDPGGLGITITSNSASNVRFGASFNRRSVTQMVTLKSSTDQTGRLFEGSSSSRLLLQATQCVADIGTASVTLAYDPSALFDGNAHLIVWVCNTTETSLWVDGVEVATGTHSDAGGTISTCRMKGNATGPASGNWDDYAIWTTPLSDTTIGDLWTAWQGSAAPATATLSGSLQAKTAALTMFAGASATLSGTLQAKTAAITLDAGPMLTLSAELQRKTAVLDLEAEFAVAEVELAGTLQAKAASFTLDAGPVLSLAGDLQRKTAAVEMFLASDMTLAGDLQAKTATFGMSTLERPVRLDGTLRRKTANITLKIPPYILLAGTLRRKTAVLGLAKPPTTDFTNMVGGLTINGYGLHTWSPPVVAPPAGIVSDPGYETAIAFSPVTVAGAGRATYTPTEVRTKRHRIRIKCGGKDITYLRDVPTPAPSYMLIEPLDYGAGKLTLPQINAAFEQPGVGSLAWCAKGKPVLVQRVDVDTGEVVATDYRGFITDYDLDGSSLVCALGGAVSGRMALKWHPLPVFKSTADVGRLVADRMRANSNAAFSPLLGPTTGIRLHTFGGMNELDWFNEVMAKSQHLNGAQYTVTRRDDGVWHMPLKDRTTVDFTIYLDGNRMPASLHQSLAEEPNRIFSTGVTKEGERIDFVVYPGLVQGAAAPYPFDDESPFSAGTTDGDTDTGDGVTVMVNRLIQMGYLSRVDADGYDYDAEVTAAIKVLQDDANLSQTGTMNAATWEALYDLGVTGYSLAGATTLPAAQRSYTRMWRRSASGAILERNPNFDPQQIISDANYDMGPGFTGQQIRQWSRDELGEEGHWEGTATCNLAVIRGEHTPGDPFDPADIMPAREIRPGMNAWAPLFDGGTLFHVSGVQVPEGGGPPQLILDTKARDTMKAWEVITRNRESRRDPARIWFNQYRSSKVSKDALATWNRLGGRIDKTPLTAGWNVFPVVAGQAGTVQRIRIRTLAEERFCVAVFGKEVSVERLRHINPTPLTEAGTAKWDKSWVRNWFESRYGLYIAGGFEQRCGYWPGKETGDDGEPTGDPITGVWDDAAGFSYYVNEVLWVAVWADGDCYIPAGRIMWNQRESGA